MTGAEANIDFQFTPPKVTGEQGEKFVAQSAEMGRRRGGSGSSFEKCGAARAALYALFKPAGMTTTHADWEDPSLNAWFRKLGTP